MMGVVIKGLCAHAHSAGQLALRYSLPGADALQHDLLNCGELARPLGDPGLDRIEPFIEAVPYRFNKTPLEEFVRDRPGSRS